MATGAIRHKGLIEFPVFHGLPEGEATNHLLKALDLVTYKPGETFFREGAEGPNALFVILEGEVEIRRRVPGHPAKVLATFRERGVIGETALLLPGPRTVTAVATTPTTALMLSHDAFDRLVASSSPAAVVILANVGRALASRLRLMNDEVVRLLQEKGSGALASDFTELRSKLYGEWKF